MPLAKNNHDLVNLVNTKKWSKEECRLRYVEGEKISQRTLSEQSGRALGVLSRWCRDDDWVGQRDQYVSKVRAATQKKTIEKTSELLSDDLAKRNEDHVKGYEIYRGLSIQFSKALLTELQTADNKLDLLDQHAMAAQRYANIYNLSIQGERASLGMDYMDINKAIARLIKDGYDVIGIEPEEVYE